MNQCKFCSTTGDKAKGEVLYRGALDCSICIQCVISILGHHINLQDKKINQQKNDYKALESLFEIEKEDSSCSK